ncbi:hypothetical protein N7537_011165 [Penicillium hordei]|uniref:Uncharacterized protein n=1 Tax=Penicillium hordei TaxID=40994 RepID=A0AAD6DLB9_9EURO|nr:uncharacterized protein N7537_011165 [Penicillium hordei]KAJ5588487.1 hypothetical protein N7537_011165 [Penicillium hordei]
MSCQRTSASATERRTPSQTFALYREIILFRRHYGEPRNRAESFTEIEIGSDREIARERAETTRSTSAIVVYSDTLGRKGHLGAAVVALDNNLEVIES